MQRITWQILTRIDTTDHRLNYPHLDIVLDLLNRLIHVVTHLLLLLAPHLVAVAPHFLFGPTGRLILPLLVVGLNSTIHLFTVFAGFPPLVASVFLDLDRAKNQADLQCVKGLRKVSVSALLNTVRINVLASDELLREGQERYWAVENFEWSHRLPVYVWVQGLVPQDAGDAVTPLVMDWDKDYIDVKNEVTWPPTNTLLSDLFI